MATSTQSAMGANAMAAGFYFQTADGTSTTVTSSQQIYDTLTQLGAQQDPNIDLVQNGVGTLSISVKDGFALLRNESASLDPPYFSASVGTPVVPASSLDADGNFNFLVGDTPTPVPPNRGVPIDTAVQVAQYYYQTGSLSPNVQWIED